MRKDKIYDTGIDKQNFYFNMWNKNYVLYEKN